MEDVFTSHEGDVCIPNDILLPEFVLASARAWKERPALIDGISRRSYNYGQVQELVSSTVRGLQRLGIREGQAVMLLLQNCPEYPILFLGIVSTGAIVTTANPAYRAQEIKKQAEDSATRLVITSSEFLEKVLEATPGVPIVLMDEPPHADHTAEPTPKTRTAGTAPIHPSSALFSPGASSCSKALSEVNSLPRARSQNDVCVLPYSSGTTGTSKGVMLTHRNLIANVQQMVDGANPRLHFGDSAVVLGLLPMFHIYALTVINLLSLRVGATVVTMPRFDMETMLGIVQRHRVTLAPLVPPIMLGLAKLPVVEKYDLSSLRSVVSGAAPLGPELEAAVRGRLPHVAVGQGYGMTESSPVITLSRSLSSSPSPAKPGSAGSLLPLTQAWIIDTSNGRTLPRGQRGEILIRGPQVMAGYLNNPEATAATVDSEGWLRTGDVGYLDEEGELFVVDRVKELIKVKGFQVPPAELEALLLTHPSVLDAAVVPAPDEEAGEVPVAFVVIKPNAMAGTASEAVLLEFVARQVATYKRLHQIHFVTAIPKSASGKILRRELRSSL